MSTADTLAPAIASAWATLLWSTPTGDDDGPEYLDGLDDAQPAPGLMARLADTLAAFVSDNAPYLDGIEQSQWGHDLILTANHHGTGFWDRGLGERGDRLTTAAHALGPIDAYVGDDGLVYVMGWEVSA